MKKGFTLIELLIVLAIIGTLVAIAVVRFADLASDRDIKVCQANLRTLNSAIAIYRVQEKAWPDVIATLRTAKYIIEVPQCPTRAPVEGVYSLDNTSGDNDRAKCNLSADGHVLPSQL